VVHSRSGSSDRVSASVVSIFVNCEIDLEHPASLSVEEEPNLRLQFLRFFSQSTPTRSGLQATNRIDDPVEPALRIFKATVLPDVRRNSVEIL